jgi:hypothetical protein
MLIAPSQCIMPKCVHGYRMYAVFQNSRTRQTSCRPKSVCTGISCNYNAQKKYFSNVDNVMSVMSSPGNMPSPILEMIYPQLEGAPMNPCCKSTLRHYHQKISDPWCFSTKTSTNTLWRCGLYSMYKDGKFRNDG